MKIFEGGAWRSISSAKIYIGGQWRRLTRIMIYSGGEWRTAARFVSDMSVEATGDAALESRSPLAVVEGIVTAVPTGGFAPFTYSWTLDSSDGGTVTIADPTQATTTVRNIVPFGQTYTATFSVTATDGLGNTATDTCSCLFTNT